MQDTLAAFISEINKGREIKYPKGFLSAVMKNKYNSYLRKKYRDRIIEYTDVLPESVDGSEEYTEEERLLSEEYAAVRREIGRLVYIYREVTVRHYVHGHSVEKIAAEMGLPRGTVLSRLSTARTQIKEGLKSMEKYSKASYEPKTGNIGIMGSGGIGGEPFSLISSDIEVNILFIAYKNPVSVRDIADTMGMPCAYLEPLIDRLVSGELMGKTVGGLVYTRCFVCRYEDTFGDIPAQEAVAAKYAPAVWSAVWRRFEPLSEASSFAAMTEKQKATLMLFYTRHILGKVVRAALGTEVDKIEIPDRPDAGKWLASLSVYERGQWKSEKYDVSGPVMVNYSENGGKTTCRMYDCQSVFGDAHWVYSKLKYKYTLRSILRFYASFLESGVKPENAVIYELIPEFEKLHILRRDENGEAKLDIPALTFEEATGFDAAAKEAEADVRDILLDELKKVVENHRVKVPSHVDGAQYYEHDGALGAYTTAQLIAIAEQGLMPYRVEIGKTPLIYLNYKKEEID